MTALLRALLVASALVSTGVVQLSATLGEDVCCAGQADEREGSCPDCPPGLACACCPIRGAVEAAVLDVAPAPSRGVAIAVVAREPALVATASDIFHPPRA